MRVSVHGCGYLGAVHAAAMAHLGHEVVGIGDAENDHSFLERCECAVAVANAVPSIKQAAAFVTQRANGDGVTELIDELVASDLRRVEGKLPQYTVNKNVKWRFAQQA